MDTEMKIENWNGYDIRFVDHNGEWWAVAKDVTDALGLRNGRDKVRATLKPNEVAFTDICDVANSDVTFTRARKTQRMYIISEKGIYRLAFKSRKPEAEAFQDWVFNVIKYLREQTGLEGFEVFRMMDKEHQKQAMTRLHDGLSQPMTVDYIKANMIANKAVSNKYGYPKLVKKDDMTPQMMKDREPIVDEAVNLMITKERYGLDFSVSDAIYNRLQNDTNNGGIN